MQKNLIRLVKTLFFSTPLYNYFLPKMKFDMTVKQLIAIFEKIEEAKAKGNILEIGVGGGSTSILINYFLKQNGINGQYIAIDTFSGFTQEDVNFEQTHRNKVSGYKFYQSNSKNWFKKSLAAHGFVDAVVIEDDCKIVNYEQLGPIAFCLFDVDLYLPTKVTLPKLFEELAPGGIILVDDCDPSHPIYDGAHQAYLEFCEQMSMTPEIIERKIGVIRRPPK